MIEIFKEVIQQNCSCCCTNPDKTCPSDECAEYKIKEFIKRANLIHLDSIYICPECGDSGRKRRDIDHKTCESCPVETICSGICEFKVDCPCLKKENALANIRKRLKK